MRFATRRVGVPVILSLFFLTGCGRQNPIEEEGGSPAEARAVAAVEPRHGGRIVELSGENDAELVISESGMSYVYLYDAQGDPVPYEGKQVKLIVSTPDGKSEVLPLEGMGSGAGAHFMNPISEEMFAHMGSVGTYEAEIEVVSPGSSQVGHLEVEPGRP